MNNKLFIPHQSFYRKTINSLKNIRLLSSIIKQINPGRQLEIKLIFKAIQPSSNDVILDLGCGDGYWANFFSVSAKKVIGIDPYESDLNKARNNSKKNTEFYIGHAEKIQFPNDYFDSVMSVCVFEHLKNDEQAFLEIFRVLKKGGKLAATVDSLDSKFIPCSHIPFHMKTCYCNQLYTITSLTNKLTNAGFINIQTKYIMGSRLSVYWEILTERIGILAYIFSPIVFPIILLLEKRDYNSGYKIFIRTEK